MALEEIRKYLNWNGARACARVCVWSGMRTSDGCDAASTCRPPTSSRRSQGGTVGWRYFRECIYAVRAHARAHLSAWITVESEAISQRPGIHLGDNHRICVGADPMTAGHPAAGWVSQPIRARARESPQMTRPAPAAEPGPNFGVHAGSRCRGGWAAIPASCARLARPQRRPAAQAQGVVALERFRRLQGLLARWPRPAEGSCSQLQRAALRAASQAWALVSGHTGAGRRRRPGVVPVGAVGAVRRPQFADLECPRT